MTGYRIGWAVANPPLIGVMGNILSHQTSCTSGVPQAAAAAAIMGDQSSVDELRRDLEKNRDVIVKALEGFEGISFTPPEGTFYCFVDFKQYDADSARLSEFLLEKVKVVTVPGVEFGMDGFLRFSYCGAAADIVEGVERIKWALAPGQPEEMVIGGETVVRDW